ncbi:MAG: 4-hydroxybenzoate octaprenyltransferase [Snodgrassella sp.]|uniref:4-hydroxybenzoate octaprenyltransferase n=1 Tax=Snodgrassella TaxID=1193515 RepID=UPI000B8A537B|nr:MULTISPECIES: 4-hydroxybenzoate octaprenyltransferase [Snodgrassella]MCO6507332.1 4-hydroxybenzoate octaprenyltransferase [Snodgrassella sp.]
MQLMRIDRPIGTLLLLWPTWWALWIAADGHPDALLVLLFGLGTFLMRSAGCVINDYADRHFDGAVERTCQRPFALNKVSKKEALTLTLVLCILAALCLLPMNRLTWMMSIPALFLAITYPFTKRFFPLPQLYLGLAFSFGIPMAFAAVSNHVPLIAWVLLAANTLWTLAYDTIYAMADKEDDLKIGIHTSAITFGEHDITAAMLCHAGFDILMILAGWLIHASFWYWLALPLVLGLQYWQWLKIRTRDRKVCFTVFVRNNRIGLIWFAGLLLHYWLGKP